MKKIIIVLICSMTLFAASAQVKIWIHTTSNPTGAVVNTGKDTSAIIKSDAFNLWGIQIKITKASSGGGTVSTQSVIYKSNYPIGPWHSTGDTLNGTNQAVNSAYFEKTNPGAMYYIVITTGTGTMSATAEVTSTGWKFYSH